MTKVDRYEINMKTAEMNCNLRGSIMNLMDSKELSPMATIFGDSRDGKVVFLGTQEDWNKIMNYICVLAFFQNERYY